MSLATVPPRSATEPGDAHLLARARDGDHASLEALLARHLGAVEATCRSRLRSPDDAADAAQETIARALRSLDTVRNAERFRSWLCAIAVRVCADAGRRHAVAPVALVEDDLALVCTGPRPDETVVSLDDAREVRARLSTLGERDQHALWMRDALGLPVAEVAGALGVTEGSARVLLTRARHRLRAACQGLAGVAVLPGRVRSTWMRWMHEPAAGAWRIAAGHVAMATAAMLPLAGMPVDRAEPAPVVVEIGSGGLAPAAAPIADTAAPHAEAPVAPGASGAVRSGAPSAPAPTRRTVGPVVVDRSRPEDATPVATVDAPDTDADGNSDAEITLYAGELIEDILDGDADPIGDVVGAPTDARD